MEFKIERADAQLVMVKSNEGQRVVVTMPGTRLEKIKASGSLMVPEINQALAMAGVATRVGVR